jgi:hypothetical protein
LDSGEVVLWSGRPSYFRRLFAVSFIMIGFLFVAFVSLIPTYGLSEVGGGFILLAFLLMWNLYFLWAVRGVIYFVTDRRILKKSPRVLVKRTEEVTLSMVIDVRAKRFLGTNQLVFRTSEGKTLTFRALRQDHQSIQQIAIDAKKKVSPNSPVP